MEERTIEINTKGGVVPFNRFFLECANSCHAYLTLREDFREHLRLIQSEIGFKRLRFHGIFHDWVGVCQTDFKGGVLHNFQNVDIIYDNLVKQGIKPFVEIGFMPELLASGSTTIFNYKANTSPPSDWAKWEALVSAFVRHLIGRYGLEEVRAWHFEIWNEPNLEGFWPSGQEAYFNLYGKTARVVKDVDAKLRVGGPATALTAWVPEFLAYCAKTKSPVDFVSTHHYCASRGLILGKVTKERTYRGIHAMADDIRRLGSEIKASPLPDLPLYITEWNVTPAHEDTYGKDSEFTATFMLENLRAVRGLTDIYALWAVSDVFEESGITAFPFSGKYGLVNLNGIKKPSYHAFRFLSGMYDMEIDTREPSMVVTRNKENNIKLLTWNHNEPTRVDYTGEEWEVPLKERKETIRLSGLSGRRRVRVWRVDRDHGNAWRAWQAMGSPQYLSAAQAEDLKHKAEPVLEKDEVVAADGVLVLSHVLPGLGIRYYEIDISNF